LGVSLLVEIVWLHHIDRQKEKSSMTRIKLIGLSLIAVIALLALTAASASAAEEKTKMLPESGVTFTAKSGVGKLTILNLSNVVECKKDKGKGTIESANLGKFETDLEECKAGTGTCTGTGEASGVILTKGTFHFWLALETLNGVANTLVGALVFLPEEAHYTCVVAGLNQLFLVKGCMAALATPLNTLASITKDTFALAGGGAGDQLITLVLPQEAAGEIECVLLTSINGGAFTMSALEDVAENENFKKGETAVTVLLMNPEGRE
jgi:hypothetical protein